MTRDEAIHALVEKAYSQVGVREGANNWNKYAADPRITKLFGWNVQNQPWCATFTHWLYIETFGFDLGAAMTYGGSAACKYDADFFKNHGAWSTVPEKGAVIYFYANGAINHQGVVVDVSGATITTVEGNYSDKVSNNTYYVGDPAIAGFGIPNWSVVANESAPDDDSDEPEEGSDEETTDIIHPAVRRACYRLEYGDGVKTKEHPEVEPLPQVKAWQSMLVCWGFSVGTSGIDGEFGMDTDEATRKWQKKAKAIGADVEINGIVDTDDWEEIVKVPVN